MLTVFSLALTTWVGFSGYLFVLDPLQIFHKPWWRQTYFVRNLRLQAAGIINSYDFDSLILGTSMAQNFSPAEASTIWRANYVNLSPDGSSLYERALILGYALRKKSIKNVILSLDNIKIDRNNPKYPVENYGMLYNLNPFDDILAYVNANYLTCWAPANRSCRLPGTVRNDLRTLTEWASIPDNSRRFGGLDKWFAADNSTQIQQEFRRITKTGQRIKSGQQVHLRAEVMAKRMRAFERAFDLYLLHYIERYPDTVFYLFFPPYSRLDFGIKIQTSPDEFALYTQQIRYIVSRLRNHANAKVFGFEHLNFLDDIANYKDTGHYHQRFDAQMMQWMHKGEHQLHDGNADAYIAQITFLAKKYDVLAISEQIEQYLGDR